ncbi:hypothetical protein IC615_22090 [Serratia ureilytica]
MVAIKGSYQIGTDSRLGISVVAGCYLSRPEHFVNEAEIWEAWKRVPLSLPILDVAEPKPFAEYLIAGHAGIGQPVKTLNVSADIGGLKRRWRVEGEDGAARWRWNPSSACRWITPPPGAAKTTRRTRLAAAAMTGCGRC